MPKEATFVNEVIVMGEFTIEFLLEKAELVVDSREFFGETGLVLGIFDIKEIVVVARELIEELIKLVSSLKLWTVVVVVEMGSRTCVVSVAEDMLSVTGETFTTADRLLTLLVEEEL